MIFTVTLNPAIDNIVCMQKLQPGGLNRAAAESIHPGGKGVNVSLVLHALGSDTTATGFLAGATGKAYEVLLNERELPHQFLYVNNGYTRINLKITADQETEINGKGPELSYEDLDRLCDQMKSRTDLEYLVLSGNVPSGVKGAYHYILEKMGEFSGNIVVDVAGQELLDTLIHHPFLIKPNQKELEDLFHVKLKSGEEILSYAKKLQEMGARNVLVSLGADGMLLVTEKDTCIKADGIKGDAANTVGAGDSTVAGFLYGWNLHKNYSEALRWAAAAGTATAFSYGIAEASLIRSYYEKVKISETVQIS